MAITGSIEPPGAQWDYFIGGVPPLSWFDIQCGEINALIATSEDEEGVNIVAQLAVIGLVAYFEGFFRALFSALINICPTLLENLAAARPDLTIPVRDVIAVDEPLRARLGFLLGSQLDFSSPRATNAAFRDLVGVSPFSKDETERFQELLRIRNSMVHYGGVHTTKYEASTARGRPEGPRLFADSIAVTKPVVLEWSTFLSSIAVKTNTAIWEALTKYLSERNPYVSQGGRKAIDLLSERLAQRHT